MKCTPVKSVRLFCISCIESSHKVSDCGGNRTLCPDGKTYGICLFFPYREGKRRPSVTLIRRFCLQCMKDSPMLVRNCESKECPVHLFRMGTNPNRAGIGDESNLRIIKKKRLTG